MFQKPEQLSESQSLLYMLKGRHFGICWHLESQLFVLLGPRRHEHSRLEPRGKERLYHSDLVVNDLKGLAQ